jgi:Ca2+-binding EF-hand superfamily protein
VGKRICLAVSFIITLGLVIVSCAWARPPAAVRASHADRNKDGVVTPREAQKERQWEHKQRMKDLDENKDGKIDATEIKHEKLENAQKVNTWWEKRADTNGDGVVDATELTQWKQLEKEHIDLNNDGVIDAKERRLSWRHAKARVNTDLERKYDLNGDGWLEPNEVKELLKDKHALIATNGQAKVDTEIEKEYDTNNDGIIDKTEAEAMKEDVS